MKHGGLKIKEKKKKLFVHKIEKLLKQYEDKTAMEIAV